MMSERRGVQLSLYTPSLEEIVNSDEMLRKLEAAVDFSFIYDELRPYYSPDNGRYSTDPVVIVKSLLIAFLYGIISERRLEFELQYNARIHRVKRSVLPCRETARKKLCKDAKTWQ